ncbi:MAG: hypothetical protein IJ443_03145 [Firmicutes bacterium]|nr:hypothetical protein [Bacillota bacterium]
MKKKLISSLLILTLVLTLCFSSVGTASAASYSNVKKSWKQTGDYLYTTFTTEADPAFGSIGGEWMMYGLAEAGYKMSDEFIETYQKSVEAALEEGYRGQKGILHDRKYTEYSRVIIAYAALGLDPTDINGYNMVEQLADFDKVIWQGINGPIFALRALDAGDYEIPEVSGTENVTTRQKLINYLLENQLADGGWALSGTKSDPDLTAMGLESLAPYYKQKKVKAAMDKAIECLSEMQNADGGYSSWGIPNLESAAQVVSALSNVGINANTDSRFKKNGKSVIDAMMTFYDNDGKDAGGFRHVNTASGGYEAVVNQMATEQGYYALAQYFENVPSQTASVKLSSPKSKALKVSWKNQEMADGFQIKIATNSGFSKNVKNVYVKDSDSKTRIKTITGLKKGKTYYVKVRAYKTVNGKKLSGIYSTVKKIIVK